jgi:hypothetical protein
MWRNRKKECNGLTLEHRLLGGEPTEGLAEHPDLFSGSGV